MRPPKPSDTPLIDLARSLYTVERTRDEFIRTTERNIRLLDEMRRTRERALDVGIYSEPISKARSGLDVVLIGTSVTPQMRLAEIDPIAVKVFEYALRDVVNQPDFFKQNLRAVLCNKGSHGTFFPDIVQHAQFDPMGVYRQGRFLEPVLVFGVTHPEFSSAMSIRENVVALLGHLTQNPSLRAAIFAQSGNAVRVLRGLFA